MSTDKQENRRMRVLLGLLKMSNQKSPMDYLPFRLLSRKDKAIVYKLWGKHIVGHI